MPFFGVPIRNGLPIGLGSVAGFGAPQEFTPAELFIGGIAGTWYDPSDLTTMFTTSAGTTPVAMPGQGAAVSVGRILDKSGGGNHAIAINDGSARPVLSARVNLLTYSEEFDNGAWVKTNTTAANTTATTDPLGGTTAEIITALAGTAGKFLRQNLTVPSNVTFSVYAKADTQRYIQLMSDGDTEAYANFDLQAGAGQTGTKGTKTTSSITDVGNGWYRCVATFTGATAGVSARVFFVDSASAAWFASSTSTGTYYIWGADLRPANIGAAVPAYQRIADANTYDTAGFPLYLLFDGIDDGLYTPANLNLTATDKVGVFAGVRKLSDAAQDVVAELSATIASNNGTFLLAAPDGATQTYGWDSKGTAQVDAVATGFAAPITNVVTGTADIAGDSCIIRVNGTVADTETGDQGSGNYGSYPLNIGVRSAASSPTLYFNGHLHGLIVVGSAVSAGNISATESWMAQKTGIVI